MVVRNPWCLQLHKHKSLRQDKLHILLGFN